MYVGQNHSPQQIQIQHDRPQQRASLSTQSGGAVIRERSP